MGETSNTVSSFEHGLALHRDGKLKLAVQCYQEALQTNPDDHRASYGLGMIARQAGDLRAAEGYLRQAARLGTRNPDYQVSLGMLLQESGRPLKALECFRRGFDIDPTHYQARFRLALLQHRLGEHSEALALYRAAAAQKPNDVALLVNLGALLNQMRRHAEAVPLYRRAIELQPDLAAAHGNLGNALAALGHHEEAIEAFGRSLTLNPGQPRMHANLGSCLLADGQVESARQAFETCLRAAPGDITALAMMAAINNEQRKREAATALLDYDGLLRVSVVTPPTHSATGSAADSRTVAAQAANSEPAGAPDDAQPTPESTAQQKMADFLQALRLAVLAHPTLKADPHSHTTRDGQQTGALWPSDDPAIKHLVANIRVAVNAYIRNRPEVWQPLPGLPPLWPAPQNYRLDIWATVLGEGGHQTPHIHPTGWVSGVFYVDVPMSDDEDSEAGWIEFGNPPNDIPLQAEPLTHRHRPRAGELVLFPSYFFHDTIPLHSPTPRISIAFDVIPVAAPPQPATPRPTP